MKVKITIRIRDNYQQVISKSQVLMFQYLVTTIWKRPIQIEHCKIMTKILTRNDMNYLQKLYYLTL